MKPTLHHMVDGLITIIEALHLFEKSPSNQVWLHHGVHWRGLGAQTATMEMYVYSRHGLIQSVLMK